MDFGVTSVPLHQQRTGCLIVGVYEGRRLSPSAEQLDLASAGALHRVIGRGDLEGKPGATLLLHDIPQVAAERVLLVGVGNEEALSEGGYRKALSSGLHALRTTSAQAATICLNELPVKGRDGPWKIGQGVLAVMEAVYRFDVLKSRPADAKRALEQVRFHLAGRSSSSSPPESAAAEAAIHFARAIGEGIVLAKDLGNMPGNVCTPTYLADQALAEGRRHGFEVRILGPDDIAELGMGAFLAVARGSVQPPRLIVMEYHGGTPEAPPVVLVGKGITFDSGGISLKPPADWMK